MLSIWYIFIAFRLQIARKKKKEERNEDEMNNEKWEMNGKEQKNRQSGKTIGFR